MLIELTKVLTETEIAEESSGNNFCSWGINW